MCLCVCVNVCCVEYVFVCVWARAHATMPLETRRRYWIPWSWNYTRLWAASYGCWDPKRFLEEQAAVFTSKPSFWLHICMYVYKMYMLVQFLVESSCTKLTFSQTKRQHTISPTCPFFIFWVQEMQALQKHWTCEATEGSSEEFNLTQRGYILITCSLFPLTSQPSSSTQVLV